MPHEYQSQYTNHTHEPTQPKNSHESPLLLLRQPQSANNRDRQYPDRPVQYNAHHRRRKEMHLSIHACTGGFDVPVSTDGLAQEYHTEYTPCGSAEDAEEHYVAADGNGADE
jgi:hypothetical protein